MSKFEFKTEVNQLLDLVIHSLYSNKEIFLRELISNASDALDKLQYLTLSNESYKGLNFSPKIELSFNEQENTITIEDNGIGMSEIDLQDALGTIAKSGTKQFLQNIQNGQKDSNLIGQFGVGFYASFMVADKVEVYTKRALEDQAYLWSSDGKGSFNIEKTNKDKQGTKIILFIKEDEKNFIGRYAIETVIKKYSDHIMYPIFLDYEEKEYDDKGEVKGNKRVNEQVNAASALWKQAKSKLKQEDYYAFYKTIAHDTEDPLLYIHTKAEGTLEYTTLFFIPKVAPMDMYRVDYQSNVKLYVSRVFITDDDKELLPTYLRFVKGVIDSEDLPLNVSREILQSNKILANIKQAAVKKILGEIEKLQKDEEKYSTFIEQYNRPLKEGVVQDFTNKDLLLDIIRFKSSKVDGWVSLSEYKSRMQANQKSIYYIVGNKNNNLKNSPLLEAYKSKDIEVLIMDDEVDDFIAPQIPEYQKIPLLCVNRSDSAKDLSEDDAKAQEEQNKAFEKLITKIKETLKDEIKDVKVSSRLSDSPVCIVLDENDPTAQMSAMMKSMGQSLPDVKPILEINPKNNIIEVLNKDLEALFFDDVVRLLFDQAQLLEGKPLKDAHNFSLRLNQIINKAIVS